ncbi:MAG: hypothetical protein CMP23_14735 [Rickettsiales bacterium]|nr:hypothetical protein [Rickettsiales bacterium]
MRTTRKTFLTLLAVLLLGLPLVLSGATSVAEAEDVRALVVLEEDEPQATYPFMARTMSESRLAELLFRRFFTADVGGDLESGLFEPGWSSRPPNLSLAVREGLKFSDGEPVTFSDVSFTLNDVYRRTDVGHSVGGWYSKIFGDAQQITPLHGSIRFQVSMPDDGAERYLMTSVLLSRKALAPEAGGKVQLELSKRKPTGTGPFFAKDTIESFDDVLLHRNPHDEVAVRKGQPVQAIRLLYDQDAARQKELMEGGRADLWVSPPPAVLPSFRNESERYGIRSYDLMQWWFMALNHAHPALADARVREALDLAIPRQQLIEKFGGDSARSTSGPFLPGSAWAPGDVEATAENRDRVITLMEEAGYSREGGRWVKDGEGFTLRLGVQSDIADDFSDVVYGFQDAWESLGFRVRVKNIRPSDWRGKVEAGQAAANWDVILGRWNLDREEGVLSLFSSAQDGGPQVNLFKYSDQTVDGIVADFYKESSGPAREALMQKLHRYLHSDRPYLFLWTLQVQSVYRRDRLSGFRPSPFYYFTQVGKTAWKESAGE